MTDQQCQEHSGCLKDIDNLKHSDTKQWQEMGNMRDKIDNIMTRLNVILGSVVVAIFMMLINFVVKIV